jgi:hypothetical protein
MKRLYLKAFIQHFHPEQENKLLLFLPEAQRQALSHVDVGRCAVPELAQAAHDHLQLIHYSWLPRALERLAKPLQEPTLAALPPKIQESVCKLNGTSIPSYQPSLPFRHYLLDRLFQALVHPKIHPRALLASSSFDPLLSMGKRQVVDLIDYLGIHDLASTMRHIVDKDSVQQIMLALPARKRNYLKLCLRAKNPLRTPDINLKDWDRSSKQLQAKLQRRGLVRLAKALAGQDPSFLWYLAHSLDIGRGRALMRQLSPKPIPGVTSFLEGQVHQIVRYMQK